MTDRVEIEGIVYYWTGWLQPADSTELLAQWQCYHNEKIHFTVASSQPGDTDALGAQKKENGLRSLQEAIHHG